MNIGRVNIGMLKTDVEQNGKTKRSKLKRNGWTTEFNLHSLSQRGPNGCFPEKVKVVVAEEAEVRNIWPLGERIFEKAWNINYRLSPGMYEIFLNAEGTYYLELICRKVRPMITIQSR